MRIALLVVALGCLCSSSAGAAEHLHHLNGFYLDTAMCRIQNLWESVKDLEPRIGKLGADPRRVDLQLTLETVQECIRAADKLTASNKLSNYENFQLGVAFATAQGGINLLCRELLKSRSDPFDREAEGPTGTSTKTAGQ
jgi:hypothetical protein